MAHCVHAAIRVMQTGMALGEAGGAAVALAKTDDLSDVRQVDVQKLRERLKQQGARV